MGNPAWDALPPMMRSVLAAEDARAEREAEVEEARREDDAVMAGIVADHQRALEIARFGCTTGEMIRRRQEIVMALSDRGFDPMAPKGSAANPELLIDGASLPAPAPPPAASRSQAAAVIEAARAETAAWSSPPIMRQRRLSLEAGLAREWAADAAELRRAELRGLAGDCPPREVTRAVAGAVPGFPPLARDDVAYPVDDDGPVRRGWPGAIDL